MVGVPSAAERSKLLAAGEFRGSEGVIKKTFTSNK